MAVDTKIVTSSDLAPAISIDLASNFTRNIRSLQEILGITTMQPMAVGTVAKQYKLTAGTLNAQSAEGDVIPLTDVSRQLVNTINLVLKAYRKQTTAQAIQSVGSQIAINDTDAAVISKVQAAIKTAFFTSLATGIGTVSGAGLQAALANAWNAMKVYYADFDASPVYFVSPADIATYLGSATISMQTAFGMSYVEDFLGLGTVIIAPSLQAGTFYATAKENLRGVYIPATGGDVAREFGLNGDETGLVGFTHHVKTDNAAIDTLIMTGVTFFPEMLDGVFVGTISNPS